MQNKVDVSDKDVNFGNSDMHSEKWIGLTGGIASGKSTVTEYLRELGYFVIDADAVSKDLMDEGKPLYNKILDTYKDIVWNGKNLVDGEILNREVFKLFIFDNEDGRRTLNTLSHYEIFKEMKRIAFEYSTKKEKKDIIFFDIPLLFETENSNGAIVFDRIWLIDVEEDVQKSRLMERNSFSSDEADKRIASQFSRLLKRQKADVIIENNGTIDDLKEKIREVIAKECI